MSVFSDGVCSGEMLQRLANAFNDVDLSTDNLNFHAAYAQKVVRDTFCSKLLA